MVRGGVGAGSAALFGFQRVRHRQVQRFRDSGEAAAVPTPTATPTATPNPYDVNRDGVVDIQDVMLVAAAWEGN